MLELILSRLNHLLTETHDDDPYHHAIRDCMEIVKQSALYQHELDEGAIARYDGKFAKAIMERKR